MIIRWREGEGSQRSEKCPVRWIWTQAFIPHAVERWAWLWRALEMEDSSCMLDTLFVLSILRIPETDVEPPGYSPTEGP